VFLLRPARPGDLPVVRALGRLLGSPSIPQDEARLRERFQSSQRAFGQPGPPSDERVYQFILEDAERKRVGTSAIFSKHGTPQMPHFYLEVKEEERYSQSIDVRAKHVTLHLDRSTDGPTEIGALILHPRARSRPGFPGKLLSWGRFAYIATHRDCFEEQIIAEMRATLDPHGQSLFWESVGKRFTGLSYEEADRRSAEDKSFIKDLFPDEKLYASLLDPDVAAQLGEVHEETGPALRLLEQAAFRWNGQIDPFDAGPYFAARTDDVSPIRTTVRETVGAGEPSEEARPRIVSAGQGLTFRAVVAPVERHRVGVVRVAKDARRRIGVSEGDSVAITPLPRGGKPQGG
jgi:arginine N-succinyltransferase